jgi:UDP-N-acetylglucosamine 2-epimerase (non-hydrolysing)
MEAGNRCFDQRTPEETNRKIVDHVADVNLPYSDISREYLLREGLSPDYVVKTGSPMKEVIRYYMPKIERSTILRDLSLEKGRYLVVSCHREENVDDDGRLGNLVKTLNMLASHFEVPLIMTTHPRTRKRFEFMGVVIDSRVRLMKPLRFSDYVCLQRSALLTLSDSGTLTEESSLLGLPAVNLREAHERPEGMEEATVPLTGLEPASVLQCAEMVIQRHKEGRPMRVVNDYDVDNVSEKVLNVILSYTHYVNRNVWRKS